MEPEKNELFSDFLFFSDRRVGRINRPFWKTFLKTEIAQNLRPTLRSTLRQEYLESEKGSFLQAQYHMAHMLLG